MAMAASLSSFGGQNVMLMRQNDMSRSESMLAMLTSCTPHVGFQVPRAGGGLADAIVGVKRPAYYPTFEHAVPVREDPLEDGDESGDEGGRVEKKRRLSFDQVRSLERNFEVENKLEPERKMQLAKELGLQPRQVAVWFQNRRARWKTKQLERDYEVLNSGYLKLKADFETALREKDLLKAEVQRLSGKATSTSDDSHAANSSQCGSETTSAEKHPLEASTDHPPTRLDSNSPPTVDATPKDAPTSSGSNSSELFDADSPRASSQGHFAASQFAPESFAAPPCNLLEHVDVSSPDPSQPVSFAVKLEEGFHVDIPSCNYFLPPIGGDHSVLPWWDWP